MGEAPVHRTVQRLAETFRQMGIPFAISGALAVNHHGHLRATQDVDVLLRSEDLQRFKERHIGLGWVNKFEGSKGFRDTRTKAPIDVLLVGEFPGDGKPKPVRFPDPRKVTEVDEAGVPYITLPKLVELKLASGMTAVDRPRDLDDVIQLIRVNQLDQSFGEQLDPYVREAWYRYWDAAQHRDDD